MQSKSEAGITLDKLCQDIGIPNVMVTDVSGKQTGKHTNFTRQCNHLEIILKRIEPYSPWQNRAENSIGKLKAR